MADGTQSDKVKVYTPGHTGVVIDKKPLEPGLPDDSLRTAQNATHDPLNQNLGALRKRPGLKQFTTYLGGPVLGGIPMPVAATGGAPAVGGGGNTGSGVGGGNATGAPGGTGSVGGVGGSGGAPSYSPPGAGLFNGGTILYGGARLIVFGLSNNTSSGNERGMGWYVASKNFANNGVPQTTPGPPSQSGFPPHATPFSSGSLLPPPGKPFVFETTSKYLYYGKAHNQDFTTSVAASIRKTNGAVDVAVITFPKNPATTADINFAGGDLTQSSAIMDMHLGTNGLIFICLKDKAAKVSTNTSVGRLYKLDPNNNALTEINTGAAPGSPVEYDSVPYCCAYFNRRLFWGEYKLLDASGFAQKDTNALVRTTDSGFTYAPDVHGFSDGEVTTCMVPFPYGDLTNEVLFVGFGVNKTVPALPFIYKRKRGAESSNPWLGVQQASGGAATNGNYWVSMVEFAGNLYASFYNPAGVAKIYQLAPNFANLDTDGGWDGTGTWTAVHTAATALPYMLYTDSGVLYAIGSNGVYGSISTVAITTTDGTTWVVKGDQTNVLPIGANQSYPLPIFAGFDQ